MAERRIGPLMVDAAVRRLAAGDLPQAIVLPGLLSPADLATLQRAAAIYAATNLPDIDPEISE